MQDDFKKINKKLKIKNFVALPVIYEILMRVNIIKVLTIICLGSHRCGLVKNGLCGCTNDDL